MNLIDTLSKFLPPSPVRRRPFDLTYAADERPPGGALALLSLQHAATAIATIAYVLASAKIADLSVPQTQIIVAVTLVGMAIGTALQSWGGRLGSGSLLIHDPDPFMIPVVVAAIVTQGPSALIAVTVLYALVALGIAPLLPRSRALFPPAVAGAVICMGGLTLVEPSIKHSLGINAQMLIDPVSALISGSTLVCIVAFSVWGGRRTRLLGLLAGIAIGLVIATFSGHLVGLERLATAPLIALPEVVAPSFSIDPSIVVVIVLIAVLTQLDTLGSLIIMDKMNNADWRRADMQAVSRGIKACGLGNLIAGFLGSFPTGVSSCCIALAHATKSTSRYIGLATATLLLLLAFMPKATMALTLIPSPVLGAVEVYAVAFLTVSGMELITSRVLGSRGIFMVGLGLCAGLVTMLMPGLSRNAPASLQLLLGNGLVVTGVVVILLNLLFRLGTQQRTEMVLKASDGSLNQQIMDFVERQGAYWNARSDVVHRAALAALEAAESIVAVGRGRPIAIRGSFDEFDLDIELVHMGKPLQFEPAAPLLQTEAEALWDADEAALDAAMLRVSSVLIQHLADRVTSKVGAEGTAVLALHFEH